jgi:hypothetical protein
VHARDHFAIVGFNVAQGDPLPISLHQSPRP